jgi:putative flippase GtrA
MIGSDLSAIKHTLALQQVRFLVVGALGAGIYFVALFLMLNFQIMGSAAPLIAYGLSFGITYLAHRKFVFRSELPHIASLPRYLVVQATCATVAWASVYFGERYTSESPFIISTVSTLMLAFFSYIASSRWAFKK